MDFAVDLASTASLHVHPSGALTFCGIGDGPAAWDDDLAVFAVAA